MVFPTPVDDVHVLPPLLTDLMPPNAVDPSTASKISLNVAAILADTVQTGRLETDYDAVFRGSVTIAGGIANPRRKAAEAAPGGAATTKAIVFADEPYVFDMPDASYLVIVEPHGNCICWVTAKAATGFIINYSVVGGVEVAWEVL